MVNNRFSLLFQKIGAAISHTKSAQMDNTVKKVRYDGRSKKRAWQERRQSNSENDLKKTKLENGENKVFERIKRKKYAMLLGYCGVDYLGMQRNPGTKTIEEDILKALLKVNYINEEHYNQVQSMQFQRSCRTDKGVSAVRQVISLKLPEVVDISKINEGLPDVIRVFGLKKVTKGFNCKTNCDSRTYSYTLPSVAFVNKDLEVSQAGYRINDELLKRVNDVLLLFTGTKNFHNFTSKKSANDPSANRYIKSFYCEKVFLRDDVEFAVLKIQGQSFMLHQIRKMVALMLAIVRNHVEESILHKALANEKVNIPRAPGLGLLLEFVHYDRYNFRYGEDGVHEKLLWEETEETVNDFKEKFILPTITSKEIENKEMVIWLSTKLKKHVYDDSNKNDDDDDKSDNEEES